MAQSSREKGVGEGPHHGDLVFLRRYAVVSTLSESKDAAVYLARDLLSPRRPVVVKATAGRIGSTERSRRLLSEYEVLRKLRHPHVPEVLDFGEDLSLRRTFLVTRWVAGTPLHLCSPLEEKEARSVLIQVARALTRLHALGVLHLDIKPSNILWDPKTDHATLVDYDLATPAAEAGSRGTLPYAAPEVLARSGLPTEAADLYSLGVVGLEVLGGFALRPGYAPQQLAEQAPPTELQGVLARMFSMDPKDRFPDARSVLRALRVTGPVPLETDDTRVAALSHPPFLEQVETLAAVRAAVGEEGADRKPLLVIDGRPGTGKSRHLEEALSLCRVRGDAVLHLAAPAERHRTLAPIRELLRALHVLRGVPPESVDAMLDHPSTVRVGLLERMVAATMESVPLRRMVIGLDDVHRYDRLSRDFLVHLLRRLSHESAERDGRVPIKLVLTTDLPSMRDDYLRTWLQEEIESGQVSIATVTPLGRDASEKLIRSMVAPEIPPADLVAMLHEGSHGNPTVIREAILAPQPGARGKGTLLGPIARMARTDVTLPGSAEATLVGQLERLPEEDKRLLAHLLHFPEGLSDQDFESILGYEPDGASVSRLVERGFLQQSEGRVYPMDRMASRSLRERLSKRDQRHLHDRATQFLSSDSTPQDAIVCHWLKSSRPEEGLDQAFDLLPKLLSNHADAESMRILKCLEELAGVSPFAARVSRLNLFELAMARGQLETARRSLARAKEATSTYAFDLQIHRRSAQLRLREGHLDAARRILEGLLEPVRETSRLDRADLHMDVLDLLMTAGRINEARDRIQKIVPLLDLKPVLAVIERADSSLALPPEDEAELARLTASYEDGVELDRLSRFLTTVADMARLEGQSGKGLRAWLLVMRLRSRSGDLPGLARSLHGIGTVYMQMGNSHLAERYYRRALRLRGEVGDLGGLGDTANNLGVLLRKMGRTSEALEQFRRSLRHRRQIGHVAGEGYSYINIANVHYQRRELDAAVRYYDRALKVARRLNDSRSQAQVLNNLGAVATLRGLYEEALLHYEAAERLDRVAGNVLGAIGRRINRAESYLSLGAASPALDLLDSVSRALRRRQEDSLSLPLALARARLARLTGQGEATEAHWLSEANRACLSGPTPELKLEMADFHLRGGRPQEALPLLLDGTAEHSPELLARSEMIRARALMALGSRDLHETLIAIGEGERLARRGQMTMLEFQCCRARGMIRSHLGELHLASGAFALGLESLERLLRSVRDDQLRAALAETPEVVQFELEVVALAERVSPKGDSPLGKPAMERMRSVRDALFAVERRLGAAERAPRRDDEALRRLLDLSRTLRTTAPLDELLTQIVDGVIEFSRAERAFLITVDDRGSIRIPVARTRDQEPIADPRHQISSKIVGDVLSHGKSVCLTDAVESHYAHIDSVLSLELRSVVCTPLLRGGAVVGMLYVDNRSRAGQFTSRDQELLDIFAAQAAVALENGRMARDHARDEKLRVLGRLAGDVAHDFNNLLTAILGRAELLLAGNPAEEIGAGLRVIEKAAKDGSEVVRQPVRLRPLIEDALEFVRPRALDQRTAAYPVLSVLDVPDEIVVSGTAAELREVFTNLLLNSYAAMPEGGTVSVTATAAGDRVVIVVSDTGIGMTEEVLESVFDPYFTTRGESGSGLGMSISRNIIDRHGGEIRVESAPLEGTRVIIDLPQHFGVVEGITAASGDRGRAVPKAKLLLVEDEASIRELLMRVLSGAGFHVVCAPGGLEGLAELEKARFDLVLTDLGMTPCNGWEVAQRVKRKTPGVPVLLLTGFGAEIDAAVARKRGVDVILRKPFEVDHLIATVTEALLSASTEFQAGAAPEP